MAKKWIGALSVALTAAMVVSGCATKTPTTPSNNNNNNSQAPAEPKKVTLRLTGWASSPAEADILNKLLEGFNKKYPEITVKYEPVNADYDKKIQADAVANTMADVFYMDVMFAPDWISKGLAIPLDQYMSADGVKADAFETSLISGFQSGGKTYGLPKGYSTLGLFYNQEMLDKAGVKVPTTWDELKAAAKTLSTGDVKGLAIPADHARFVPFIYMAGGKLFSADKTTGHFNSAEAVEAAKFYTGFVTTEKTGDTPKGLGAEWAGDALAKGKAAMVLEGHWMIPFMVEKAPNMKYGVAELPAGPKGKSNFVFTVSYSVSKSSKNPAEAFKLVNYLTSEETQKQMIQLGLELPSLKSLANDPFYAGKADRQALIAGVKYAQPFQYTANQSPYVDEFGKALENMILNNADPKAELDKVQAKFESVVKK